MATDNLLKLEQQEILLRDALAPLVISVLAFGLGWFILSDSISSPGFGLWVAAGCSILLIRSLFYLYLRNPQRYARRALHTWVSVYSVLLFVSGALWGSLVLFWSTTLDQAAQLQIFLFPVAMAAGAVSGYGTVFRSYVTFLVPCMLPVVAVLAVSGHAGYVATTLPATLYFVALLLLCMNYQARLRDAIALRMKNEALVESLSLQNDELVLAKNAAEDANRSKSEFLARMSHEIRTPMNGVLGMTQVLQSTSLDDSQQNIAQSIYGSGESLLRLINDLLDVSKVEAGKLELELEDFNLHDLLPQVVDLLAESARKKSIGLEMIIDDDVPTWIRTDQLRLRQIITNLLSNAVKFTQQGAVKLEVKVAKPAMDNEGPLILYSVTDSGIGISDEKLDMIFEAFSQADGSTTRKFGGTGLGLSIAKQLALLMGGSIEVESTVGEGSTFRLLCSAEVADNHRLDAGAAVKSRVNDPTSIPDDAKTSSVLLVEDNLVNQQVAMAMLEASEFQVTLAEHGEEALEAVSNDSFDVILMDCQMPVMDGYEATRQIRAREKGVRTPIIAVTANAIEGDRERCLEVGMDDYLSKPFKIDDLELIINRWAKSVPVPLVEKAS